MEHPGGLLPYTEEPRTSATVVLNPILLATASHAATPKIGALPLAAMHVPVTTLRYPKRPGTSFRQESPLAVE